MPLPTGLDRDPKSGYFHLRIGVPKDLQPHWPPQPNGKPAKNAFRGSLNTRDRADAIARAHALIAEHHLKFASLRDRNRPQRIQLTPKLVEYLQSRIKYELLEGDDIRRIQGRVLESVPMDLVSDLPDLTIAQRLTLWARVVRDMQAQGHYGFAMGFTDKLLSHMGLPPADWAGQAKALAIFSRTLAQTYTAIAERASGIDSETPTSPGSYTPDAPAQPEAAKTAALTLRDIVPDWERLNDSTDEAGRRMNKALALWEDAVGVLPIDQITRATGGKFVLYLLDKPARKFGDKTAANHASYITALMNVAEKLGTIPANPLDLSFRVNDSQERTVWTHEELERLHGTPVTGAQPEGVDAADADLLMSMLLWSGARVSEIAGLRVQDIQERDGILAAYIRLESTKKARHGAKDVSVRWLPIAASIRQRVADHAQLRRDSGHTSLPPSFNRPIKVTPTDQAGRWFLAHRKRLGLPTATTLDGSHKWRHTVRTRLGSEGLGEALLDAVTGHQATGGSAGRKSYTHADKFPLAKGLGGHRAPGMALAGTCRHPTQFGKRHRDEQHRTQHQITEERGT